MIAALLALLVGISLRYVMRDASTNLWPSIRLWILGIVLQPTAWVLYGMRDAWPDWLAIVCANVLLSLAYAKHVQAVRTFVGRPRNWRLIYAPVLAIALLELVFTYNLPSMRLRLMTVSSVLCLQMMSALIALLGWGQSQRRSHRLTASAFLVLALVLIVRIAYEGLRDTMLPSALAASAMQTLAFGFAALFPTIATLGFVLMCGARLNEELERQATIDGLTGISNRSTLDRLATQAIALAHRHERPLAVLLIDADHFKHINDVHGHATGDEALVTLAGNLQCALRAEDLFGRLGGEEFVAVLPETNEAAARASAERLRLAVETIEFAPQRRMIPLRVSIGVAVLEHGDNFAAILRHADQAMYAAKRCGRNRVVGPGDDCGRPVVVEGRFAG
ncbi:MAG TPA: GGDEF domain-containing protein [Rudaea sp.]|nr:GGDEF domain-containing protein [Rudaea sp.]